MTATETDQLAFAGPGALAALVRTGEVRPRELVELCLSRIESLDPQLNAFRTVLPEQALDEAARADGHQGLLAGVPLAIKDEHPIAGQVLTRGSRALPGAAQTTDSELVRRLRAAGAIPLGITNVPELCIWPWTASDANGITRNPWDLSRTPGGSSGGSAAAVAAGLVPAATAADGGGSIRIPAACCGLVGMKPTRGRVSLAPVREGWLGLTVNGALARTVADSALLLDVLQGALPTDVDVAPPFAGRYVEAASRPPGRLRIAVSARIPPGLLGAKVAGDQRGGWEATATLLEELGHEVVERDPAYGMISLEFTQTWLRAVYEETLRVPTPERLEPLTRQLAGAGRVLVPPGRRDRLRQRRPRTTARLLALWDEVDVLLTPGLTRTAIGAEGGYGQPMPVAIDRAGRFMPFCPAFNLTGQPALTLPSGQGADGLPLSVQLVGRPGAESLLYALAGQIESARPWAAARPPIGRSG